ncbi:TetR/AcrR family transcriptional regulator [Amycolatopsis sp. CA-230715]|uniref:TetR/AcrR family transcriptional regulator n=1 Tax=Amycolatopsis sp. CA-230715 TaxID=2745196 RepID=UPI001C013A57|nr:TetR/AcrR family transcriptional regulator [Amycolatopsis sp. CA-230715]QWF81724.1 HTH-type transcriptional regulator BetI [Amycolatopsis sp. CA-230715]
MPKIVDKAERRREIAEALLRLVAREGIEAVSVRTVAAEAGLSAGAVQKYFSTKEELYYFALDLTGDYLENRWSEVDYGGDLLAVLHRLIIAAMPLDDQVRAEVIVILAFTARAAVTPPWNDYLREGYRDLHAMTVRFLERSQEQGDIRDDLGADQLADIVLALSEGFANRMLIDVESQPRLLESLDLALRELLAPR